MRARPSRFLALIFGGLLSTPIAFADDPGPKVGGDVSKKAANSPSASQSTTLPPLPPVAPSTTETLSTSAPVAPATEVDAKREELATRARLEDKEKPPTKPIQEILEQREVLLKAWEKVHRERLDAENPKRSPEIEAAEFKADLEKTRALLEQVTRSPDALLPEIFQAKEANGKLPESRLGEMKEAIDAARNEQKEQATQLETLRTDSSRNLSAQITALRTKRDKVFQTLTGLNVRRNERQAGLAAATSPEARELAREKLVNFDWEVRTEGERLASVEAEIAQTTKRLDFSTFQIQAKAAHVQAFEATRRADGSPLCLARGAAAE